MRMSDNERIMIAERLAELWEMSKKLDFKDFKKYTECVAEIATILGIKKNRDFKESEENVPTAFDIDKVIADLENLDVHFDNDYSSENKEPMLLRRDVFDIINKHLSGNAEHTKLE